MCTSRCLWLSGLILCVLVGTSAAVECGERSIQLSGRRGVISKVGNPLPCQHWNILAPASYVNGSYIIIKFVDISLSHPEGPSVDCLSGDYLQLGPLPNRIICSNLNSANEIYVSVRDHAWIKYLPSSTPSASPSGQKRINLQYIINNGSRGPCEDRDFSCVNGRCIYSDWQCDGSNDCGDWSDEDSCFVQPKLGAFQTPTPPPTTETKSTSKTQSDKNDTSQLPVASSVCRGGDIFCLNRNTGIPQCLSNMYLCDGDVDCAHGEDEDPRMCNSGMINPSTQRSMKTGGDSQARSGNSASGPCQEGEMFCHTLDGSSFQCIPNFYQCDGKADCYFKEDEDSQLCNCEVLESSEWGIISSPNYPSPYPDNSDCSWRIQLKGRPVEAIIQLRFTSFNLSRRGDADFVTVYNGLDDTYPVIGIYNATHKPPRRINSKENWLYITFHSDGIFSEMGFRATFQEKGRCINDQQPCDLSGQGLDNECFMPVDRCDSHWDCPLLGTDESSCDPCPHDYFMCLPNSMPCFARSDRCNGHDRCLSRADERDCDSRQCGPHNGSFLCDNAYCIYQSKVCDGHDDCGDFSDERNCFGTTNRVIIAAIAGSIICALLLVILLGCSCKLYTLRMTERRGGPRHETPMSRLYAEFLRRRAPPPYHEAMQTSRNYDEVQEEIRQLRNACRRSRRHGRHSRSSHHSHHNMCNPILADDVESPPTYEQSTNTDSTGTPLGLVFDVSTQSQNSNHSNIDRHSSRQVLLESETDSEASSCCIDLDPNSSHVPGGGLTRNQDTDDASDDECILIEGLSNRGHGGTGQGRHVSRSSGDLQDSSSIETASASLDNLDIPLPTDSSTSPLKDSSSESSAGEEEVSESQPPKPNHIQTAPERRNSTASLNSAGSGSITSLSVP